MTAQRTGAGEFGITGQP